jgi:predicted RNase H-like HicB family nuclease
MHASSVPIRVVFHRDDGTWVAHCLDFDLMGDGETKRQALSALREAIALQVMASIEHDNPRNLIKPANMSTPD